MKHALLFISFLVVNLAVGGCNHSTPIAATPDTVPVAVIASGPVASGADVTPGGMWISDQNQLDTLTSRIFKKNRIPDPAKALPPINFAKEGVLFLWLGRHPTGGYGLELTAQQAEIKGRTLMVPVRRSTPQPGAAVIQMITNPYLLLRLSKADYDTITIVDPDGSGRMVVQARAK